ncbi:MAG: NAD(P)-dependent oxidoreductase [Myxococcales bacterium]
METVLVTGAAGTVGNYVVGLCEAAGFNVVASDTNARGLRQPTRGRVCPGDLTDARVRAQALEGVHHVIHTAALIDASADTAELGNVNTELVVKLFEDAAQRKVQRFVHMSTCMLYAPGQAGALTEDAAMAPRGPHGLSKLGAEAFLRGRGRGDGPAWTILRAAPVYGRRGRHFAASLLVVGPLLRLFTPFLPRLSGGPRHTFVHAEDVARALIFALLDSRTHYGTYNVADEDPMPLGDRISHTFDAYGLRSLPGGKIPGAVLPLAQTIVGTPGVLRAFDTSVLALWRAVTVRHQLKPALRPRLDREAVTLLGDDLVIDTSRLRALGFAPRHARFAEGWDGVLRWYQAENWVPRY